MHSPAGLTRIPGPAIGQQIQEMIATVGQHVPQGSRCSSMVGPIGDLQPFTRARFAGMGSRPRLPPGRYTHDAIAEVEEKKVTWIVTPVFEPPTETHPDEWKTYLTGRYDLVWANPGWGLWKRTAS